MLLAKKNQMCKVSLKKHKIRPTYKKSEKIQLCGLGINPDDSSR